MDGSLICECGVAGCPECHPGVDRLLPKISEFGDTEREANYLGK